MIGSRTSSYGGNSSSNPAADCSPIGHEVGLDAECLQRVGGLLTHRRHLDAGERARVEAVLLELLAHGAHRVDRRERDPLIATGHQPADGALHLLRSARRLDRDRRHLCTAPRHRRAARSESSPACSLVRGTSTRQPNSAFVSNHDSAAAALHDVADHEHDRAGESGGLDVGGQRTQRRDHGVLVGCRAGPSRGDGGVGRAPVLASSASADSSRRLDTQDDEGLDAQRRPQPSQGRTPTGGRR